MEMKQLVENLGTAVHELKKVQSDSLKSQDALLAATEQKLVDHITKTQEQMQKLQLIADATARPAAAATAAAEAGYGKAAGLMGNMKLAQPWQAERKQMFSDVLRRGDKAAAEKLSAMEAEELKDFNVVNDANGGFMVAPEMANFISSIAFETSPLRALARVQTISSDYLEVPISDQRFGVNRVGENGTAGVSSTPQFGLIRIPAFIYESRPRVSQKMLDDAAYDIEGFISQEVADEISRQENTDFFTGDGTTRPQGLLTLPTWSGSTYARGGLERVNSGSSGALTADGLRNLQNSLKEAYQPKAVFLMRRATYGRAMLLKDSQNRYLIGNDLLNGNYNENPTLLGKKVIFCDDMPAVAAASLSVAYGDFQRGYTIVDRVGIRVQRDPYTVKPLVEFYTTKRTGGAVTNYDCLKLQLLS